MAIGSFIMDARSMVTLASFITFLGIIWWAYGGRRRDFFEQAGMLPLMDDIDPASEEHGHG